MRHLIDTYIRAEESEKVSAFDDLSLVQLIVERGADAVNALPEGIRENKEAVAETIENNVRKLIIDEQPINPKYYEKMSRAARCADRAAQAEGASITRSIWQKIVELTKKVKNPTEGASYPKTLNTAGQAGALRQPRTRMRRLALAVDGAVLASKQDDWRGNTFKVKKVSVAIKDALESYKFEQNGREQWMAATERAGDLRRKE